MDEATAARRWEVWRQDDNGNRYLVSAHADEAAAQHRLADLESGVMHKQTYWVSESPMPRKA
ncbi:SPOR domain-containing protein [Actinospica sp.]|uniref:SPOR domain-containing protein n=1 Tax=Actinospica sp. TaxID=1872142 RepID=UPI002CAE1B98|nr:SPOR domain-containing protein [Actinospica sp.]HWG26742.1 SPOR domain-containing protein [Actinospica sp.]